MKLRIPLILAGCAGALCLTLVASNAAMAHEGHDHDSQATTAAEVKERMRGKLDNAKQKVCANRTQAISKILTNAATAGQRHLNVFNDIATKVEKFYTDKKTPVSTYDAAVAKVGTKRAAVEAAIAKLKEASTKTIDCTGSDPVGQVDGFKDSIKLMHDTLKDYRTALKDLIVIVKQAPSKTGEAQS